MFDFFRISWEINPDDFLENYMNKREPVILLGCQKNWPAQNWTFRNILDRFPDEMTWAAIFKNSSMAEEKHEALNKHGIYPILDDPEMTLKIFEMLPVKQFLDEIHDRLDPEVQLKPGDNKHKVIIYTVIT